MPEKFTELGPYHRKGCGLSYEVGTHGGAPVRVLGVLPSSPAAVLLSCGCGQLIPTIGEGPVQGTKQNILLFN